MTRGLPDGLDLAGDSRRVSDALQTRDEGRQSRLILVEQCGGRVQFEVRGSLDERRAFPFSSASCFAS